MWGGRTLELERLRRETARDHEAVEGTMPLMSPGLKREEYIVCLQRMYGVVSGWEETAIIVAPEWMRGLLVARQRKHLLELDLACIDATGSVRRPVLPRVSSEAGLLGLMYVMEGSTLGGQLIARQVEETLGLEAGYGNAYFRGHGQQTGAMWEEFCEVLRERVPEQESETVIGGAKEMFRVFSSWMQRNNE
jgi:heme oxygenase